MKLAALLYAADYTVRKQEHMQAFARGFLPMAFALAGVGMLLLLEPDLGAFMVIVAIAIGILFLGGINGKYFSSLLGVLVSTFLMLIWLSPWRRARLFAYLDPWNEDNAYGSAYQLSHSLIALGRGEWLGVGLGASVEKLHYLPEAHTDFLMAVVGETRLRRRHAGDLAVRHHRLSRLRHRPPGHRHGTHVRRPGRAWRGHVVRRAGLHQHGRVPGPAAHQGPDAAADELWRLGRGHEPVRARHADTRGRGKPRHDARGRV